MKDEKELYKDANKHTWKDFTKTAGKPKNNFGVDVDGCFSGKVIDFPGEYWQKVIEDLRSGDSKRLSLHNMERESNLSIWIELFEYVVSIDIEYQRLKKLEMV